MNKYNFTVNNTPKWRYASTSLHSSMNHRRHYQLIGTLTQPQQETLRLPPENIEEELKKELALILYQRGILSSGKTCRLAGLTSWEFEELLKREESRDIIRRET